MGFLFLYFFFLKLLSHRLFAIGMHLPSDALEQKESIPPLGSNSNFIDFLPSSDPPTSPLSRESADHPL